MWTVIHQRDQIIFFSFPAAIFVCWRQIFVCVCMVKWHCEPFIRLIVCDFELNSKIVYISIVRDYLIRYRLFEDGSSWSGHEIAAQIEPFVCYFAVWTISISELSTRPTFPFCKIYSQQTKKVSFSRQNEWHFSKRYQMCFLQETRRA